MTTKLKLELRKSEIETRMAEIAELGNDDYTDEIRSERKGLLVEIRSVQERLQAAIIAEDGQKTITPNGGDAEHREFVKLRSRVSVGRYLDAGIRSQRVDGAELEFRQAVKAADRTIPYEAFEEEPVEERADAATAAPGTVGVNMQGIVPNVFSMSAAAFLAIGMPRVPSGQYSIPRLTTDLTAGTKGKGAAQESTAGAFTVISAKPKRIGARLSLRAEDLAEVGIPGFESSLRQNLRMVLGDTLDVQLLRGDGQGANLNGLATQLAADAAQANANSYANAASDLAAYIDGKFAHKLSDLRVIHNIAVYARLAALFATNDDSKSHLDWCSTHGIEAVANANMAASAANVGDSIVVRAGMARGKSGMCAVAPVWGNIEITDIYTDSASAMQHVSLHLLLGNVLVRYPEAYRQWKVKTA